MGWWGKLLGGAFGFVLGGPLGAVLGAAVGHNFDRGLKRTGREAGASPGDQQRVQLAFFTAAFSVMGYIAKADGRVSEQEIATARAVMAHMQLTPEQQRMAIRLFQTGKEPGFDLDAVLDQFRAEVRGRKALLRAFLEIQLHAAYADGAMHAAEHAILLHICERIGFARLQFQMLDAFVRAQQQFREARGAAGRAPSRGPRLEDAYAVLGVSPSDDDATVKKAYRRLMNQHHPQQAGGQGPARRDDEDGRREDPRDQGRLRRGQGGPRPLSRMPGLRLGTTRSIR